MIELLIFASGAATGALAVALPYNRAVRDRDVLQAAKDSLAFDVEALTNRVTTLRGDNLALEKANRELDASCKIVDNLLQDAKREIGRLKAEAVAKKPKRGPGGKFVAKKPKPVACG